MSLLGLFSIFSTAKQTIKESLEPTIPAENWANKELYHQDLMKGMSAEERMRNVKNGRYKLTETYPEPHRDKNGKIIIENSKLYHEDVKKYGAVQAQKWVRQGKYNLTPEELEKEKERIKKKMEYLYGIGYEDKKKEIQKNHIDVQQQIKTDLLQHEAELKQRQKIKLELENARQVALSECRDILTKANYNDIEFSLKHCTGITNEPYGYNIGCISMQKSGEKYTVGFEVLSHSNLPEENGNALLKSLATVLASVDISDLDNRNLLLKEALNTEEIVLRNENENYNYNIVNDILTIVVIISSLEVSLQFYTSEIKSKVQLSNFDNMDGHEFEFFCASLLRKNGYENVSVTSGSGDQGVDIIAYKDDIKYGIQCKCYHSDIGNKAVQEVYAGKNFYNCDVGVVMTNRYFTKSAIELAKKNRIHLWDRKKLIELIEKVNNN